MITKEKISTSDLIKENTYPECGGLCSFEGIVRNHHKGKDVTKIVYEAYEPMAEKELKSLQNEIEKEWPETHVHVKHRIGELPVSEVAVAISVWAPHRKEAFLACEAMINRIKKRVPIFKKEFYTNGKHEWVRCTHQSI